MAVCEHTRPALSTLLEMEHLGNAAIVNAVPANGGDELLLLSSIRLIESLGLKLTSVHSNQKDLASKLIPDLPHEWDLERAMDRDCEACKLYGSLIRRLVRRGWLPMTSGYKLIPNGVNWKRAAAAILKADYVFLSAGGYLNSRYTYAGRLLALESFVQQGKKIILLPQSIGPFKSTADAAPLFTALRNTEQVLVRDQASVAHLRRNGYCSANLHQWPDLGLMAQPFSNLGTMETVRRNRVLFCVREWKYRMDAKALTGKIIHFLNMFLKGTHCEIVCASTCQGVDGYVDDSKFVAAIVEELPSESRQRIVQTREHFRSADYWKLAASCDLYIGMRLHGAILAMHAGKPALAIAYEEKSKEIFGELGLSELCVDMEDPVESWLQVADSLMTSLPHATVRVKSALSAKNLTLPVLSERLSSLLRAAKKATARKRLR